jgi:hypothetical protein
MKRPCLIRILPILIGRFCRMAKMRKRSKYIQMRIMLKQI